MKARVLFAAALMAVVLLVAAAFPLAAADVIGKISYLGGSVEIVRDGEVLARSQVKTGLELQNFDVVKTGPDGEAEVRVSAPTVPAITIRVAPGTQFAIEIGKMGSKQQTNVSLMIGSVTLKCAKLTGSQSVKVQTDTTVMGVRGTNFTVTAAPSGDLLVDCDEGEVECVDEDGNAEQAQPGEVVEKLFDEGMQRLPVDVMSLEVFKAKWSTERNSALKANAPRAIANFAKRYRPLLAQFTTDFATLEKARTVIDKWKSEHRSGKFGGAAEMIQQKRAIPATLLARMHSTLLRLGGMYARLLELKEYHAAGLGEGTIKYDDNTSETTKRFFERFESDRRELERKVAQFRFVVHLYMLRNDGELPWIDD